MLAATQAQTNIAQQAQTFSQDYHTKYIVPLLEKQGVIADNAEKRESEMFEINKRQTLAAEERYNKFGIPAEQRYFEMADKYSSKDEQEAQATEALGDQRVAAAGQKASMLRTMASLGIDPSSPAAIAAMTDAGVQNAAIEATAQNKARTAAKTLGMQLTSDAANFGRGGASSVLAFGQAASGNTANGLNAVGGALQGANGGAGVVQTGQGLGLKGYGDVASTWGSAWGTDRTASAQTSSSTASAIGSMAGTAAGLYMAKSDRRLKKNIKRLTALSSGIGVYQYNYLWETNDAQPRIGYMADEVEKVYPAAVVVGEDGFKSVDYSKVIF